jgi:hypothetical protein
MRRLRRFRSRLLGRLFSWLDSVLTVIADGLQLLRERRLP